MEAVGYPLSGDDNIIYEREEIDNGENLEWICSTEPFVREAAWLRSGGICRIERACIELLYSPNRLDRRNKVVQSYVFDEEQHSAVSRRREGQAKACFPKAPLHKRGIEERALSNYN